jgi:hypothetical protein
MTLKSCVECGERISDLAPACPKCGAPQFAATPQPRAAAAPAARARRKTHPITWVVFFVLVAVVFFETIKSQHEASLPPLPIVTEFRPAILGPGLVFMFQNNSDRAIPFVVTFKRPATGTSKRLELYAGPRARVSIGSREGWLGEHGDQLKVENNGYQTWEGSIP